MLFQQRYLYPEGRDKTYLTWTDTPVTHVAHVTKDTYVTLVFCHSCCVLSQYCFVTFVMFVTHVRFFHTCHVLSHVSCFVKLVMFFTLVTFCHTCHVLPNLSHFVTLVTFCHTFHVLSHMSYFF